ncbi:MAG: PmoA family protein [Verrucomicrobiae bacterium]|nr:PmoA family protein [Verrucomicrobiae bacterium]
MTPVRLILSLSALFSGAAVAQEAEFVPDRCEILPLPEHQVAFQVDGKEALRWHFGPEYPRPFFFPLPGPSGESLTRMGHPGAQNHDHHRSVWFAHQNVNGADFWSDNTKATVRQKFWYAYRDGKEESVMAVLLGWYDGEGKELMEQDLVAALIPGDGGANQIEIQSTFRPPANGEQVELGKTNFGFLAVRVAKTLSVHFGGGVITNSEGAVGEEAIFGKPARWMDYSGPVVTGEGDSRHPVTEGITYYDHPANPRYPTRWHVRSDGWMGASFCLEEGHTIKASHPLILRYLLETHSGGADSGRSEATAAAFQARKPFLIQKSERPHRQYDVWREGDEGSLR